MKTKTLFALIVIGIMVSSCTTTLQQRRVADELYETPQISRQDQVEQTQKYQDQWRKSKDTLDRKNDRYYGYTPPYGYYPHRGYPHYYWPDWYHWDFYPYYPMYGWGYPWYGAGFFGFHSYWYSPYYRYGYGYGYYPYYPWNNYPFVTRQYKRKLSSNTIPGSRNTNVTVPHTQRIRKVLATPVNKSNNSPDLRIPSRNVRVPQRTIRATEGIRTSRPVSISQSRIRRNYIRPSNVRQGGTERKYNIVPMNSRQNNYRKNIIQRRPPVYRSPSHSVNRIHNVRPSGSTRTRK